LPNELENMKKKIDIIALVAVLIVLIWSAIDVQDTYLTWCLESFPVFILLPLLLFTYKRFRFPTWINMVIAIHMIVLLVGGHYSYANVPLGYWMQDWFGFTRNNYDKIGHFLQGFTPMLVSAEILRRRIPLITLSWTCFLSICVSMTVSAIYEIIEWLASLSNPEDTEAFLGTQGYIWDTQTDMFMCLIGASIATFLYISIRKNKYTDPAEA